MIIITQTMIKKKKMIKPALWMKPYLELLIVITVHE